MRQYTAVVALVAVLLAPCASAAVRAEQLELKGGATVTVRDFDGKALAGAKVVLFDSKGKELRTLTADDQGRCKLAELDGGVYRMVVADRAQVAFRVADDAKVADMTVVLPKPKYAAGGPQKAVALPLLVVFILGGVAVAGAVTWGTVAAIDAADDDDDDEYP
jgi:hypothetical protein